MILKHKCKKKKRILSDSLLQRWLLTHGTVGTGLAVQDHILENQSVAAGDDERVSRFFHFRMEVLQQDAAYFIARVADEAQRVADAMSDAWISFARTGNPSTSVLQWPAFTNANRATMLFAKENGVRIGFDDDLMRQLVPDYDFMK